MRTKWAPLLQYDPAYNPNLTLRHSDFTISSSPRVTLLEPWFERTDERKLP